MKLSAANNLMQWVTMGGLVASLNLVQGQTAVKSFQSASTNNRTTASPVELVSSSEDFYPALFSAWLPTPENLDRVTVWDAGDGFKLAGDGEANDFTAPAPAPGHGQFLLTGAESSGLRNSPTNRLLTTGRRLNPPGTTNGIVSLDLDHSPPGTAWAAERKNGLAAPKWETAPEVWQATNRDELSRTIPMCGPVNLLCLWHRDQMSDLGLFLSLAATNLETGTVYGCRIGLSRGSGPAGGHPFVIQGSVSF